MTDHDGENFNQWDLQQEPKTTSDTVGLIINTIKDIEPLDDQFGVDPKKTVPPALYDLFFGQRDPTTVSNDPKDAPPLQTYAILDAAKIANLPQLLASTELEYRCLFKGQAYDELKDVAPWIVTLKEHNTFTRNLFSHDPKDPAPWHNWDKEPGIFIRSQASLDDIWRHFRKFTKVQDEAGKWYYLRFYDPKIAFPYITQSERFSERILNVPTARQSTSMVIIDKTNAHHIKLAEVPTKPSAGIYVMDHHDKDIFRALTFISRANVLLEKLKDSFSFETDNDAYRDAIITTMHRMHQYGFRQKRQLEQLATWDIFYGPNFEKNDPEGHLLDICLRQDIDSAEKFSDFCKRLNEIY
ncbi:DUF4123 domain-containing protein [Parasulfitobacter algicola]|uniref:DUF4123 domain-containing protein n=1 Tax=Parasulfitobacter algicola TaxID=2614809 RepID=A0ABX2IKJ7_9RHOB|nr:DUF4123 domain-containing protein [Sulfitobacter algicola]NSX53401.1 DUF4123 domain-containing protein [Sulfitobacter algicola]